MHKMTKAKLERCSVSAKSVDNKEMKYGQHIQHSTFSDVKTQLGLLLHFFFSGQNLFGYYKRNH